MSVNSIALTEELAAEGISVDFARMVRTITACRIPVECEITAGEYALSEESADRIRAIYRNSAKWYREVPAVAEARIPERLRDWTVTDTSEAAAQARADYLDQSGLWW